MLPVAASLVEDASAGGDRLHEHEPPEAFALLAYDDVDLALTYDYNLAPASPGPTLRPDAVDHRVGTRGAVPTKHRRRARATSPWKRPWIVNSRNTADEDVVRISRRSPASSRRSRTARTVSSSCRT